MSSPPAICSIYSPFPQAQAPWEAKESPSIVKREDTNYKAMFTLFVGTKG